MGMDIADKRPTLVGILRLERKLHDFWIAEDNKREVAKDDDEEVGSRRLAEGFSSKDTEPQDSPWEGNSDHWSGPRLGDFHEDETFALGVNEEWGLVWRQSASYGVRKGAAIPQ
jgi:hypothetical protein